MPRASTPRLAPGFTLPTRRTFILPGSEPITNARHLLDQTNEYVVRALNSSYPASIQPTNRTHHLHGYNTRSWFLSTGTWSSQKIFPRNPKDVALATEHIMNVYKEKHLASVDVGSYLFDGEVVANIERLSAMALLGIIAKCRSSCGGGWVDPSWPLKLYGAGGMPCLAQMAALQFHYGAAAATSRELEAQLGY
ncbi:hypothetical protein DFH27DRAFT_613418 [Peziza echinospora]|nr:hypothetical protein DFH27DRAFT_613418 [Peziza echinospora]